MKKIKITLPPELAKMANGRDYITTTEYAQVFSVDPQTVRKNHCLTGECYGIRPTKLPNKRLIWSVMRTAGLLAGRSKK